MRAADDEAVAADPFGQRMHDDVGAVLDRPAEIGRGEGVVDQQRNAGARGRSRRRAGMSSTSRPGLPMVSPMTSLRVRPDRGGEAGVIARLDEGRRRCRSAAASGSSRLTVPP